MMAKLLGAVVTAYATVGLGRKSLGMKLIGDLPTRENYSRKTEESPGVKAGHKDTRGKHHNEIPVVYSAVRAASVLHHPGLEGAEEENADHIANTVCRAYYEQNTGVDNVKEVKRAYRSVKSNPGGEHDKCALPGHKLGLCFAGGDEVRLKLLLTAGALKL